MKLCTEEPVIGVVSELFRLTDFTDDLNSPLSSSFGYNNVRDYVVLAGKMVAFSG
jgi:hypothetical protein